MLVPYAYVDHIWNPITDSIITLACELVNMKNGLIERVNIYFFIETHR